MSKVQINRTLSEKLPKPFQRTRYLRQQTLMDKTVPILLIGTEKCGGFNLVCEIQSSPHLIQK